MMSEAKCRGCGLGDRGRLFCPHCGQLTVNKIQVMVPTHKVREFWETGDPEVFGQRSGNR